LRLAPCGPAGIVCCGAGPGTALAARGSPRPAIAWNALDFVYQRNAPQPTKWLWFLDQLWPGDPQSIEMLQDTFGLLLTGDTSHQKAFLLVGPKRSGKGTIARVLLIGP
jgi:putative DNA primase/helicase